MTPVGAVLRRMSLDEVPNLLNVPPRRDGDRRPAAHDRGAGRAVHAPASAAGSRSAGDHRWAQVNGRASLSWEDRIELDIWYVENRSLALDLRILARTARLIVTGRGCTRMTRSPSRCR